MDDDQEPKRPFLLQVTRDINEGGLRHFVINVVADELNEYHPIFIMRRNQGKFYKGG